MSGLARPNHFEASGGGVEVTYSTTSFQGPPRLFCSTPTGGGDFSGSEIRSSRSELGELITVQLRAVPDLEVLTLTLILPDIRVGESPETFTTVAIETTNRTSIGGAEVAAGVAQTYSVHQVTGTASLIEFEASVNASEEGARREGPQPIDYTDWSAVLDTMPPGPHRIYVTGTCLFPTTGYVATLRPSSPQGIVPETLELDLVIHAPTGEVEEVLTSVAVEYQAEAAVDFTQVHVRPDGPVIGVTVAARPSQ